jgi:hypothetical protein
VAQAVNRRALEQAAEQLLQLGVLPDSYSEGAKKAWDEMRSGYGPEEGRRIFVQKAIERGTGASLHELVDSTYATGATLPAKKRAVVNVQANRGRPVPPTVTIRILGRG